MSPRLIKIDPRNPDPGALDEAARHLKGGGLLVLPTETVYGLATDIECLGALQKLRGAKGRPVDKPIALFAADAAQVRALGAAWPAAAERLAARFWPGALTLVLEHRGEWTGFRVPDHAVPLALLRRIGHALAVTSANLSGGTPVRDGEEAARVFADTDALILDAGPVGSGVPSSVVRVDSAGWTLLREGAISEAALRDAAGSAPA